MPEIRFFGGQLNNKKKMLITLHLDYYNQYIKYNSKQYNVGITPFEINSTAILVKEVYKLIKVGYMVDNKYVIKMGYMKEGSKVKPETIWKRGMFHSERQCFTDHKTGQSYAV